MTSGVESGGCTEGVLVTQLCWLQEQARPPGNNLDSSNLENWTACTGKAVFHGSSQSSPPPLWVSQFPHRKSSLLTPHPHSIPQSPSKNAHSRNRHGRNPSHSPRPCTLEADKTLVKDKDRQESWHQGDQRTHKQKSTGLTTNDTGYTMVSQKRRERWAGEYQTAPGRTTSVFRS